MAKEKLFPVRFELSLFEKLEKVAKREDRSVAYIVRKACEEYVKKELR